VLNDCKTACLPAGGREKFSAGVVIQAESTYGPKIQKIRSWHSVPICHIATNGRPLLLALRCGQGGQQRPKEEAAAPGPSRQHRVSSGVRTVAGRTRRRRRRRPARCCGMTTRRWSAGARTETGRRRRRSGSVHTVGRARARTRPGRVVQAVAAGSSVHWRPASWRQRRRQRAEPEVVAAEIGQLARRLEAAEPRRCAGRHSAWPARGSSWRRHSCWCARRLPP
jgi:hypothetical protein